MKKYICKIKKEEIIKKALAKNEEKHRTLVEGIKGSFIYTHNLEGVFQYISPSIKDVTGHSVKDFLKHFSTYMTENPVNNEVVKHTKLSLKGVEQNPYLVQLYHKNGNMIFMIC